MRTTVTLDPDVERLLRDAMRKTGKGFKEVLNLAIREGLSRPAASSTRKPFRVKARRMELRSGIDSGSLNRLADDLEVESYLERSARGSNP